MEDARKSTQKELSEREALRIVYESDYKKSYCEKYGIIEVLGFEDWLVTWKNSSPVSFLPSDIPFNPKSRWGVQRPCACWPDVSRKGESLLERHETTEKGKFEMRCPLCNRFDLYITDEDHKEELTFCMPRGGSLPCGFTQGHNFLDDSLDELHFIDGIIQFIKGGINWGQLSDPDSEFWA